MTVSSSDRTRPEGGPPDPVRPVRGRARPPDARVGGRDIWFAPDIAVESRLAQITGPVPRVIEVDQPYPTLSRGDVRAAVLVMGVLDDTASVERVLVLDESGQLFEVETDRLLGGPGRASRPGAAGQTRFPRIVTSAELSQSGTRIRFGHPGDATILDLRRLAVRKVPGTPPGNRPPGAVTAHAGLEFDGWVGPGKSSPWSPQAARVAETAGVAGVSTEVERPKAVVVDGDRRALLVLDGKRGAACCRVAGWLAPDRVLLESRSGERLRLLGWDTGTGRVGLVSTISPVVGNDSYLTTSYAQLRR